MSEVAEEGTAFSEHPGGLNVTRHNSGCSAELYAAQRAGQSETRPCLIAYRINSALDRSFRSSIRRYL